MKKGRIILFILLLVAIVGTGGIYAGKQEAVNNVDTGVVNIKITEYTLNDDGEEIPWEDGVKVLPGMVVSKIPYFTATGNDCYIRATMIIEEDIELENPITSENFKDISDDWVKVGDYFYYKNPLKTNESVDFFHSFEVPYEWGDEVNPKNIGDWGFSITVVVDAVQSDNFYPDFESKNPWGSITIKESIHKDGYDVNVFTTNSKTDMSVIIEDEDNIVVEPDDFFEGFKTMVPGDVLNDSVTIDSKSRCKVFFSTESLTDIDLLQKMYLKILISKGGKNTVIYDGILDADLDKVSLGIFKKGEKAELMFEVYMPEELDNEYTLRNASVKWSFEAQEVDIFGNPKTGDDSMSMFLLLMIMVVSGFLAVILLMKKDNEEDNQEVVE